MDDIIRKALIYDYYSELLTEQQRKIYQEVYFDDYSISEVARDEKITRQGVYDMLKRTEKALQDYEDKLGLVTKHIKIKKLAEDIEVMANKAKDGDKKAIEGILKATRDIQDGI